LGEDAQRPQTQIALASAVAQVGVASVTAHDPGSALSASMHIGRRPLQMLLHVTAVAATYKNRQVVAVAAHRK